MPNHYFTSTGERLTELQIRRRLIKTYKDIDSYDNFIDVSTDRTCQGCGKPVTCHAHIIAKARCKQLRKAELIYDRDNIFISCFSCNTLIENPKQREGWIKLNNISSIIDYIHLHDNELYMKFRVNLSDSFNIRTDLTEMKIYPPG